jgi:hypothetical protein
MPIAPIAAFTTPPPLNQPIEKLVVSWGDPAVDGRIAVHSLGADWTSNTEAPFVGVSTILDSTTGEPLEDQELFVGNATDTFTLPAQSLRDAMRGVDLTQFPRYDFAVPQVGMLYVHPLDDPNKEPFVVPARLVPELKAAAELLHTTVMEQGDDARS